MRKPKYIAIFASLYLLLYCLFLQIEITADIAMVMFFLSPLIVGWMVFVVIRHGVYAGHELSDQEEWGYQDRNKEELGMF